jgi:hypothetical protein
MGTIVPAQLADFTKVAEFVSVDPELTKTFRT